MNQIISLVDEATMYRGNVKPYAHRAERIPTQLPCKNINFQLASIAAMKPYNYAQTAKFLAVTCSTPPISLIISQSLAITLNGI